MGTSLILAVLMFAILLLSALSPASAQAPGTAHLTPASADLSKKAEPGKKHGFEIPKIGIDASLSVPSGGKTRSRFGKTWTIIGLALGRPDSPSAAGRFGPDFDVTQTSSGNHHAFVAPLGVRYRRAFSANDVQRKRPLIPYYGVAADFVVLDLRSPEDNVHSRFRLGYGGSAVVGTTVGASGFAEAKYLAIGRVRGFDLSGASITVGVRF